MIFIFLLNSFAHKPSFGPNSSLEEAFLVENPNISIVVYQEMSCEDDQIWLSFTAEEGFGLYVQAGVPEIDRLATYMPRLAVIARGLPQPTEDVPFDIPEGMGVVLYNSESTPSEFYEPFTQTSSWVWIEDIVQLPQSGEGYVVGWNDTGRTGKLWIATGEVEDFSDVDTSDFILWNEYVNNFHETGRFESVIPKEEESCIEEDIEDVLPKYGCNGATALFFIFPMFGYRRKSTREINTH